MKTSDLCILVSVAVAFITTAYLWFNGQKEEGCSLQLGSINFDICHLFQLITGNKMEDH